MNLLGIKEDKLPMGDLEAIGLAAGGQLLLNMDDLKALLSGRRTGLLELKNLEADKIRIRSLNAKISLYSGNDGKVDLLIHPIYRKASAPDFLDANQSQQLQNGEIGNLVSTTIDDWGNKTERLVEFDADTREFIVSDTEKILAPDMVNSEFLTRAQKVKYRRGEELELSDKTRFAFSSADVQGIRSNKIALVASILIDGGLTYVLYKGLNALFNQSRIPEDAEELSPGYYNAVSDMEDQLKEKALEQSRRTYMRNGSSR
ncbi:DUF4099 domain-containing protein [Mucilaginibacter sp. JRF]|uniref:DUF4099 domain-containing protein n=1 Tax=Mucilaginibacter sp. JRF TaxID=2780088 RepID=UPI00187F3AB4|nr:DUF4099 domain-containing protein [Mucilaginibacter sp. JRF]MBE9583384.1 DUF4099 domain-containing protein [Mucilaginibacter sp. JRF]